MILKNKNKKNGEKRVEKEPARKQLGNEREVHVGN